MISIKRYHKSKSKLDKYLSIKIVGMEIGSIIIWAWMIAYTMVLSAYTISKHRSFQSFAWDLGIFNQAFWTTLKLNEVFYYTCEQHLVESGSFFGVHFSPILYIVLPIYRLFPGPETLLIVQSFTLGIAALPIYLIGKKLVSRRAGLIISATYLLNPVVHGINCYDFHMQVFIPFLTLTNLYFYISRRWMACLLSLIFIFFVEEHLVYVLALYSLFIFIENKEDIYNFIKGHTAFRIYFIIPFLTIIYSLYWFYLSNKIIEYFNQNISPVLIAGRHFRVLGVTDPRNIPLFVLKNPFRVLVPLTYALYDKLIYFICLTGPFLLLPFIEPHILLPTIPWFTISLLSNYSPYYNIGYQYPSYVMPFIVFSAVRGLRKIFSNSSVEKAPLDLDTVLMIYLCVNLVFFSLASPLSPYTVENIQIPAYRKPFENLRVMSFRKILDKIPEGSSTLTQDNIFPHVSSRTNSFVLPPLIEGENMAYDKALIHTMSEKPEYVLLDPSTDYHKITYFLLIRLEEYGYRLLEMTDGIYLFELNDNTGLRGKNLLFDPGYVQPNRSGS